jgi:hypothetical protein
MLRPILQSNRAAFGPKPSIGLPRAHRRGTLTLLEVDRARCTRFIAEVIKCRAHIVQLLRELTPF